MAGETVKMNLGYTDVADGSSSSRSWGNINPQASEATLVKVAKLMNSLQDTSVKTLTSVKRVESKELDMTTEV